MADGLFALIVIILRAHARHASAKSHVHGRLGTKLVGVARHVPANRKRK